MDFIQGNLPQYLPHLYRFYTTYQPYISPIYRFILLAQAFFYRYIFPVLYPLYTLCNGTLHSLFSDSPDIAAALVLAMVLFLSMKALDYMRRTIFAWIALAVRLGMYVAVIGVGVYVWQRGLEQSVEDLGWVWGLLDGLGNEGQRVGTQRARGLDRERTRQKKGASRGRTRGAW